MAEQTSIQVILNSTNSQSTCAASNELKIQISIPSHIPVYCRDQSHLLSSLTVGPVCPFGPKIQTFTVDRTPVVCQELRICGKAPTTSDAVAMRFDGSPILLLTYKDLPWGCDGKVDYSFSSDFSKNIRNIAAPLIPPVCPYCGRTNGKTCEPCPPLGPNEHTVAGIVIPKTCSGGCQSCTLDGKTLDHGQVWTFYSRQIASCGQPCSQVSQVRVCNNGTMVGAQAFQFRQCQDVICDCPLPDGGTLAAAASPISLYKSTSPECGKTCEDVDQKIEVRCQSGLLVDLQLNPITFTQQSIFNSTHCSNSTCFTPTSAKQISTSSLKRSLASVLNFTTAASGCSVGSTTVPDGGTYTFYSSPSGTCGLKCSSRSLVRTCQNGTFTGDVSYSYPTCGDVACSCTLPTSGQSYDSGTILSVYKNDSPSCGRLCTDTDQKLRIKCEAGEWTDATTTTNVSLSTLNSYPSTSCADPVCDCVRISRVTIPGDGTSRAVYSSSSPTCPKTCNDIKGSVTCTNGNLTGDTSFIADACTPAICSCTVPLASGPILLNVGSSATLSKVNENTVSDPTACTRSTNLLTVTCQQGGVLSPSYDASLFKYLKDSCQTKNYDCTIGARTILNGRSGRMYKSTLPECGVACEYVDMYCKAGTLVKVSDYVTPIPAVDLANYQASTCNLRDCDCRVNGYILPWKSSKDFFKIAKGSCSPTSCSDNKITVTCADNNQVTGGDPNQYPYDKCDPSVCECALPNGGSLASGKSMTVFAVDKATCDNKSACQDSINFVNIACSNGSLTTYDQGKFKYNTCQPPTCSCSANGLQIDFGKDVYFYKKETPPPPETCLENAGHFKCEADGNLTGANGSLIDDYPYKQCLSETDDGDLGGTGGGTGNDEGPGSAIRIRRGLGDGGGGAGQLFRSVGHMASSRIAISFPKHEIQACLLPWGGGEIEFYGTIIAFDRNCVVPPDTCSKHRQSRTCSYPTWTGSSTFKYPSCTEKASCP